MKGEKQLGALDYFKLVAAFLVVAIHTSPLESFNITADFIFTRAFARIAVPFFLMLTGYFVLPKYLFEKSCDYRAVIKSIVKTLVIYLTAVVLYIPLGIYAGHDKNLTPFSVLKMLAFDGTYYHLWYLPAAIIGTMLVFLMCRKLSVKAAAIISLVLYIIGLFGDSYYGITEKIPAVSAIYDTMFGVSSYTRNGIFYAPVFLIMGAFISNSRQKTDRGKFIVLSIFCMCAMTAEALILRHFNLQRHDSMYVLLLPCMYFLFEFLLSFDVKPCRILRSVSALIYIIHPAVIVVVRFCAKLAGLTDIFVKNSIIHYISVCFISVLCSVFAVRIISILRKRKTKTSEFGRAWIEIDRQALANNVVVLSANLPYGCELMPAVKADAYGHSSVLISRELNKLGIRAFCVATAEEGKELRKSGTKGDILVLGYTPYEQLDLICKYRLKQTVVDYDYACILNSYGKTIAVHIGVDTGMNRLGEKAENTEKLLSVFKMKNLKICGVFTHLCADDNTDETASKFTYEQAERFYNVIKTFEAHSYTNYKQHILSSYGLVNYPEIGGDYARIGIALYGVFSNRKDTEECGLELHPVLSVKAHISAVKRVKTGESIGYGQCFTADKNMQIAVISIGYADGIPRGLSCGVGSVLIKGCYAKILGLICMDQMMVDISDINYVKAGDTAVIIGRDGSEYIGVCDIAEQTDTISNEVLSRMGKRLHRILV